MSFKCSYKTPDGLDDLVMESDGEVLTGLRFESGRDAAKRARTRDDKFVAVSDCRVFDNVRSWLDIYFSGRQPDFIPPYRIIGATPFREEVATPPGCCAPPPQFVNCRSRVRRVLRQGLIDRKDGVADAVVAAA